jgi:hypothetical protein
MKVPLGYSWNFLLWKWVTQFRLYRDAHSHLDDLELHVRASTAKTKAHLLSCADHGSL